MESTLKSSVTTKTQPTYNQSISLLEIRSSVIADRPCNAMRNVNPNLNSNRNPNPNDPWLAACHWLMSPLRYDTIVILSYGRREKFGKGSFLVRNVQPRGKTELVLTVKMETRHPVHGQFCSKFWAIFNHCAVTAAWSSKTRKFCQPFLRFFKRPLTVKFLKFQKFIWRNRLTLLCSNVVQFVRIEISEIVRYLP